MNKDILTMLVIYGINYDDTMERFMNDKALYLSCIKMFNEDPNFDELDKAMKSKDYGQAFIFAHTIKGVIGNLGLSPLYKVVFELVEALRAKKFDNIDELYEKVIEEKRNYDALFED